jgi:hypothetical protein
MLGDNLYLHRLRLGIQPRPRAYQSNFVTVTSSDHSRPIYSLLKAPSPRVK